MILLEEKFDVVFFFLNLESSNTGDEHKIINSKKTAHSRPLDVLVSCILQAYKIK